MSALARIPGPHRFTYDDVRAMVEAGVIARKAPLELLDGELVDMASEGFPHVSLKARISRYFSRTLGLEWTVVPDSTMQLSVHDAPEPDVYIVEQARFSFPVLPASVALVVEMAGLSLVHDLTRKALKYAEYSLAEYWVVDQAGRETVVFRQPRDGAYASRNPVPFDDMLTPLRLPEAAFRMSSLGA